MNSINEVSKKLLRRYMDNVSAQAGMEKGDPRKRSYEKSAKNAAGYERAFNKSSKYGKMGSRPVKVLATEQNEEQEMNESSHKKSPAEKLNNRLNKLDPKRAERVKYIQDVAAKYKAKPEVKEEREPSPVAGTRLISKHEGPNGRHAEVRYSRDWEEYSVHHYKDGKHMGEGPVSYHGGGKEGKEDATNTAKHTMKESVEQIDEISTGKKMAVAYRAGKRYIDAVKMDASLKRSGAHNLANADVTGKKKLINTIRRAGSLGKLVGIAGAAKRAFSEEAEQIDEAARGNEKAYLKGTKIRMARRVRQREVLNKHNSHMRRTSEGQF